MTVFQVIRMIDYQSILLHPEFQRNLVWDPRRKSRLIESILIRIPLPSFYLDALNDENWSVVDGLERLNTLHEFLHNQFALSDMEFLGDIDGKRFSELPQAFQRRIEDTILSVYVIMPGTPPQAKFTIFRRLNTGGIVLSAQEIRHCTNPGIPNSRRPTSESISIRRMVRYRISSSAISDRS